MNEKSKKRLQDLNNALTEFEKVLNFDLKEFPSFIIMARIKSFEICYELTWKCIKDYVYAIGEECKSPMACFKLGIAQGLIGANTNWKKLVEDRNLSTHTYNNENAKELEKNLKDYLKIFKKIQNNLVKAWKYY